MAGTSQVVEGVVVGDYQDTTTELGGFFIQEENADADTDPATSEGLFIADNGFGVDVKVDDIVRTKGNVSEAGTLTQLSGISDVEICTDQSGVASAAAVTLPVASVDVFETTEGMSVNFSQTLYASDNFTAAPVRRGRRSPSAVCSTTRPTSWHRARPRSPCRI